MDQELPTPVQQDAVHQQSQQKRVTNSSQYHKRGAKGKVPPLMRGIEDALVDHQNDRVQASDYFACPLHNKTRVINEDTVKHFGNDVKNCSICQVQVEQAAKFMQGKERNMKLYQSDNVSFSKFINHMLAPSIDLEGCDVLFPDTLFFTEEGKPDFWAKTDKDGKISAIKEPKKLEKLPDIRQKFSQVSRDRLKKDNDKTFLQKLFHDHNHQLANRDKEKDRDGNEIAQDEPSHLAVLEQYSSYGNKNKNANQKINDILEQKDHYKDQVAFRMRNPLPQDPSLKKENESHNIYEIIYNEKAFMQMVNNAHPRINDPYWRSVECIQTTVKQKIGIGEPIQINFFAPMNEDRPHDEIDYDFKKNFPTDYTLISNGQEEAYCYKECLKYCYYISKVKGIEILKMKVDFLKDENGFIWLFYASGIQQRRNKNSTTMNSKDAKEKSLQIQADKKKMRDQMVNDLEGYEGQQKSQKTKATQNMLNLMNNYYKDLKSEVGIEEQAGIDEQDDNLDEILKQLRPNTTASNFKEFLGIKSNCNKTQQWRAVSRKIHKQDQQKKQREAGQDDFYFADPANMKVGQLFKAFQTNYRTANQPILDSEEPNQLRVLNKVLASQPDTRATDQIARYPTGESFKYQYNPRNAANVKSELIRRNLLSRKDLMQLYRPPLKKSEQPQNNPFQNRTMVSREQKIRYNIPNRSQSSMNFNSGLPQVNNKLNGSRSNFTLAKHGGKFPGQF